MHPFKMAGDSGFQCLMKTCRPNYYMPFAQTVSYDVKKIFTCCQKWIVNMLHACVMLISHGQGRKIIIPRNNRALNFATDRQTSLNHKVLCFFLLYCAYHMDYS
jgi:hypothetical protein